MRTLVLAFAIVLVAATMAFAQSSGNFSYGNTGATHCVLNNDGTGTITGGATCSQTAGASCTTSVTCTGGTTCFNPTGGTLTGQCVDSSSGAACTSNANCTTPGQSCIFPLPGSPGVGGGTGVCGVVSNGACAGSLQAGIKTNSGNGNVFVVRPSAVIGLLTDVTVAKNASIDIGTSSALAGVDFNVVVTPESGQKQPSVIPSFPITYASRFVQISTNLFTVLGTLCTTVANPNPVGGITTATGCFISFSESTVSAASFDWIVGAPAGDGSGGLQSGQYGIQVDWSSSLGDFGIASSMTCVGPVNLTVTQDKVFSFNTPNTL